MGRSTRTGRESGVILSLLIEEDVRDRTTNASGNPLLSLRNETRGTLSHLGPPRVAYVPSRKGTSWLGNPSHRGLYASVIDHLLETPSFPVLLEIVPLGRDSRA